MTDIKMISLSIDEYQKLDAIRDERDRLKAECSSWVVRSDKDAKEIYRLKAEVENPRDGLKKIKAERDALQADRDSWRTLAEKAREALQDLWDQFAYESEDGKGTTGGLSALENCQSALALFGDEKP